MLSFLPKLDCFIFSIGFISPLEGNCTSLEFIVLENMETFATPLSLISGSNLPHLFIFDSLCVLCVLCVL